MKEDILSNDDHQMLSKCIAGDWMKLGRKLDIDQPKLDDIKQLYPHLDEKAFRMLEHWREKNGSAATYLVLSAALCDKYVGHLDLAQKICFH